MKQYHEIKSFAGDDNYTASENYGTPIPDVDKLSAEGEIDLLHWDLEPGINIQFI